GQFEQMRRHLEAANLYDALARKTTNIHAATRALQAEARCLAQAGHNDEAFGSERYRHIADPQGRLIAANAELMALELMTNRSSPRFQAIARRLAARLNDYENPVLAAPQRRFLMAEVQRLSPEKMDFPTFAAEQ